MSTKNAKVQQVRQFSRDSEKHGVSAGSRNSPSSGEQDPRADKDPVEVARDLGRRLQDEADGNDHLTAWKWPFLLARELRAFGGSPEDYLEAITAFSEGSGMDFDDAYYGVLDTWPKVEIPAGGDALSVAVEQAKANPVRVPGNHTPLYERLASVAYYLSLHKHPEPFFLPRKALGRALECAPVTVGRIVNLLVKEGVLREIDERWSYAEGKAKTYEFVPLPRSELPLVAHPRPDTRH
jgi:hypothetical protein